MVIFSLLCPTIFTMDYLFCDIASNFVYFLLLHQKVYMNFLNKKTFIFDSLLYIEQFTLRTCFIHYYKREIRFQPSLQPTNLHLYNIPTSNSYLSTKDVTKKGYFSSFRCYVIKKVLMYICIQQKLYSWNPFNLNKYLGPVSVRIT